MVFRNHLNRVFLASMRIFFGPLCNWANIVLLLLMFTVVGCNTLKKVGDDELLLTKNSIYADDEKVSNDDVRSLIALKPNSDI